MATRISSSHFTTERKLDQSGGLFELRIKAAEGIARVFYCTVVDRRIVILHQFVKKSEKTPPKELEIARRRMKEVI